MTFWLVFGKVDSLVSLWQSSEGEKSDILERSGKFEDDFTSTVIYKENVDVLTLMCRKWLNQSQNKKPKLSHYCVVKWYSVIT